MNSLDYTAISRRLKERRERLGLTYQELADKAGMSKSTLQRYETGTIKNIPIARLQSLSSALEMDPNELIGIQPATDLPAPLVTDDVVTFPVLGEVAAGYDQLPGDNWTGDTIEIPRSYLHGRELSDFFVLKVKGNSMYPDYQEGDHVLILRQSTMDRSGQIGVIIYGDEASTLKRIEYVEGEDWMTLRPVNPQYPPVTIRDEALEHCTVLGVAKMVIRDLEQ